MAKGAKSMIMAATRNNKAVGSGGLSSYDNVYEIDMCGAQFVSI
jgi:hypothetical protein